MSSTLPPVFTSITPNLLVRDVAKSTAFYRDVLGFAIGRDRARQRAVRLRRG